MPHSQLNRATNLANASFANPTIMSLAMSFWKRLWRWREAKLLIARTLRTIWLKSMSKYKIDFSNRYKTQHKKLSKQDALKVDEIIKRLANGESLEPKYHDHALLGEYQGYRECHIKPNLLLIYRIYDNILTLYLTQVGSRRKLFKK